MQAEPQEEHRWLQKLVGQWTYEMECTMAPGEPPSKSSGTERVRSIGGLWTVGESECPAPDGSPAAYIMTLGFDPRTGRYVGSFIAAMMCHLWLYDGELNADGKVLTLYAEGPHLSGGQKMGKYKDEIEFVSDDHRILRSSLRQDDGTWLKFMTAHYRRTA